MYEEHYREGTARMILVNLANEHSGDLEKSRLYTALAKIASDVSSIDDAVKKIERNQ